MHGVEFFTFWIYGIQLLWYTSEIHENPCCANQACIGALWARFVLLGNLTVSELSCCFFFGFDGKGVPSTLDMIF